MLEAYASRIADLKRDGRLKYVTVSKNQGPLSGEEWTHAHSQINATTFVPRRILYELRSAREWYRQRERCVFCDILRQEIRQAKRIIDSIGDYFGFCPYASRVPYETWIMPRTHNHQFENPQHGENRRHLATLVGRVLRRILSVTDSFHMVLHTAPNTLQTKGELSEYWRTIEGDYHWHIEILPILPQQSKSYSLKEVYFNGTTPEAGRGTVAAVRSRQMNPGERTSSERDLFSMRHSTSVRHSQRGGIISSLLFLFILIGLVCIVYVARHPLLRLAGSYWVVDDEPENSDVIVILGDDNFNGDRATRAAELYKSGFAPHIIASGRFLRPYASISELEQHDLTDRGVPQSAIVRLTHMADDTREECIAIGQQLAAHGWRKVILVTSNYHTRRSRYICERLFPAGTILRMAAARDSEYNPDSWWESRQGLKILLP